MGEIATQQGKHVIDALLDLVVADDMQTEFLAVVDRNNPLYQGEILSSPYVVAGLSDGGAHVKFSPSDAIPRSC